MAKKKELHPAKFDLRFIPEFARILTDYGCKTVFDPFAGTGRIHLLRDYGFRTMGLEIEPEWACMAHGTAIGNVLTYRFRKHRFDAMVTSPCYGNRHGDHHNAQDKSTRHSYTHDLRVMTGDPNRELHKNNSGAMQWGTEYRDFHRLAWSRVDYTIKKLMVLNIKDHIRNHKRKYVSRWHLGVFRNLGWEVVEAVHFPVAGMGYGENRDARVPSEHIYVMVRA